jgi:TonB family protein
MLRTRPPVMASLLVAVTAVVAFLLCAARADAFTEFCPALLDRIKTTEGTDGTPAATFTYELRGKTPRKIAEAALIADTDHGWYRWQISSVEMPLVEEEVVNRAGSYNHRFARSARLDVTFPVALLVRHAWVTDARAVDETLLGWERIGEFACEVPAFEERGSADADASVSIEEAVLASPSAPPFDILACAIPFRTGGLERAVSPDYPRTSREEGDSGYGVEDVALDSSGQIIDASLYVSTGFPALDQAGLRAARAAKYSGAISYCRGVRSEFLYGVTFQGD